LHLKIRFSSFFRKPYTFLALFLRLRNTMETYNLIAKFSIKELLIKQRRGVKYMAQKRKRGFAAMPTDKQRMIASKGGKAAHQKGTAHEFTPDEAREAGRKGGRSRKNRNR
jgi:general stress protein YciG